MNLLALFILSIAVNVGIAASDLVFTNVYQFQPEENQITGLNYVSKGIAISSAYSVNGEQPSRVSLTIGSGKKLRAEVETAGIFLIISEQGAIKIPQRFEHSNDLLTYSTISVDIHPNDMIVAMVARDRSVAISRDDLLRYFNGVTPTEFKSALFDFCLKYWKQPVTVVGMQAVKSGNRKMLSRNYSTIQFRTVDESSRVNIRPASTLYRRNSNTRLTANYIPVFVSNDYEACEDEEDVPMNQVYSTKNPSTQFVTTTTSTSASQPHQPLFVSDNQESRSNQPRVVVRDSLSEPVVHIVRELHPARFVIRRNQQ